MTTRLSCVLATLLLWKGGVAQAQNSDVFEQRWSSDYKNESGGMTRSSSKIKIAKNDSPKAMEEAGRVENVGYFFHSPAYHQARSRSGFLFGKKEMQLRLHFRADLEENRWCCVYSSWKSSAGPSLAFMLIYETAGESLDRRTIKYRFRLEHGDVAELQLCAMDRKGKAASVKTMFGIEGPKKFTTEARAQDTIDVDASGGNVFLVQLGDKPIIQQIDRAPDSFEHDDFLKLTKEIIANSKH